MFIIQESGNSLDYFTLSFKNIDMVREVNGTLTVDINLSFCSFNLTSLTDSIIFFKVDSSSNSFLDIIFFAKLTAWPLLNVFFHQHYYSSVECSFVNGFDFITFFHSTHVIFGLELTWRINFCFTIIIKTNNTYYFDVC